MCLLPSGSYRQENSGEGCYSVSPGLDRGPDGLVRVGREADPVTAEVQHIQFAVGIMAPDGCAEGVILCIMECSSTVCRGHGSSSEQRGYTGVEPGDGVEPV